MIASDTRLLKEINLRTVLQILRHRSPLSRAEVARLTGLTPATVSSVVGTLLSARVAEEVGLGESNGGRRPVLIQFNPQAFYLVGVDLGVGKILAVVIDLDGRLIARRMKELERTISRADLLHLMFTLTREVIADSGLPKGKIAGIGLSVPGLVDSARGVGVIAPNLPDWRDVPVVSLFEKEFRLPTWVENDSAAMALGEARFGAGRGRKNLLCVNVGRGIGSGLILNGSLYRGEHGGTGEIGHMTIDPNGPACPCGNNGCLEVLAAGPAITAAAIRAVATGTTTAIRDMVGGKIERITAETVSQAALQGDALALRLIKDAGRFLGIGIANAINLFGPECVIVGGGVSRAGETLLEEIRKTVKRRAFGAIVSLPEIAPSLLGDEASAVGAATLALEMLLESEEVIARARVREG